MIKRRAAATAVRPPRAARSRLTALVVSAVHARGPVGQAGAAASFRLRDAGPAAPSARAAGPGLPALVVPAVPARGPVGQAGAAASFRLRDAGPAGPCRVSLEWCWMPRLGLYHHELGSCVGLAQDSN